MDIRDFAQMLKDHGELVEVNEEVSWEYEIPAFELMSGRVNGPAFLFNNVKGIKEPARVLTGHFASPIARPHRRLALALGMDPEIDNLHFSLEVMRRMTRPIRPVEVATGPCKEVVKTGKEVNLFELPFTYHAIGDGGRYCFQQQTIIKDPDSDWQNVGHYCMEIFSPRRVVITPYAQSNFRLIYMTKYEPRNMSMPIALVIGTDPACYLVAATFLPPGVSEYDIVGSLRGTPLEVVKCETSDLLVPANAEVVLEGEVRPYEELPEGPKPESFGFCAGPRQPNFAVRVNCITHRKNPVLLDLHQGPGAGGPSLSDAAFRTVSGAVAALGFPVKAAHMYVDWCARTVVSLKDKTYPEPYPGFRGFLYNMMEGNAVLGALPNPLVLDPDVNLWDREEVIEAIMTQTNPVRDVIVTRDKFSRMTIDASYTEEEDRAKHFMLALFRSPHLYIDATTKEETPLGVPRTQFETLFPPELQKRVVDNWKKWGFEGEPSWHKDYIEFKGL